MRKRVRLHVQANTFFGAAPPRSCSPSSNAPFIHFDNGAPLGEYIRRWGGHSCPPVGRQECLPHRLPGESPSHWPWGVAKTPTCSRRQRPRAHLAPHQGRLRQRRGPILARLRRARDAASTPLPQCAGGAAKYPAFGVSTAPAHSGYRLGRPSLDPLANACYRRSREGPSRATNARPRQRANPVRHGHRRRGGEDRGRLAARCPEVGRSVPGTDLARNQLAASGLWRRHRFRVRMAPGAASGSLAGRREST